MPTLRSKALPSALLDTDDLVQQGRTALHAFICAQRNIDPALSWCRYEASGGICADSACSNLHAKQVLPTGQYFTPLNGVAHCRYR